MPSVWTESRGRMCCGVVSRQRTALADTLAACESACSGREGSLLRILHAAPGYTEQWRQRGEDLRVRLRIAFALSHTGCRGGGALVLFHRRPGCAGSPCSRFARRVRRRPGRAACARRRRPRSRYTSASIRPLSPPPPRRGHPTALRLPSPSKGHHPRCRPRAYYFRCHCFSNAGPVPCLTTTRTAR